MQGTTLVVGHSDTPQDRAELILRRRVAIAIVADGAGGSSGGAVAADLVVASIRSRATSSSDDVLTDPAAWCTFLSDLDQEAERNPEAGETTVVVAVAHPGGYTGASVGDSGAWLVRHDAYEDLTSGQRRKPLVGSGVAVPTPFEKRTPHATLLVASDGIFRYARSADLCDRVRMSDLAQSAKALVDLVRLASGALQDDCSIVLVR